MSKGRHGSSLSFLPHEWIRPLARFGYASRGAVYLIIGFFATLSGLGPAANKDSKGALRTILEVAPMNFVHTIAMAGLFARGCVFAIISLLLFYRINTLAPSETEPPGLLDALQFVQQLSLGSILLTALGVGLILFSGYSFSEALWRNINVEDAAIEEQLELRIELPLESSRVALAHRLASTRRPRNIFLISRSSS